MPFKIKYKFKDDENFHTCVVSYPEFQNFRELPIVQECEIIKTNKKNIQAYENDVQETINLISKNDTSHIQKLC